MRTFWSGVSTLLFLSACSTLPERPFAGPSLPSGPASSTLSSVSKSNETKVVGFQIAQCYSPGAPEVGINYSEEWARRVSRAETEDELLGRSRTSLGKTGAYAEPISAVSYIFPQAALDPPTEGICEIKFDLSRTGEPSNVISACSSTLFVEAATDAVKETRFKPVMVNGSAAKGVNLTYKMKYCLAD